LGDRFEQFIRAPKQGVVRFHFIATLIRRIQRDQMPLAMLAHDPFAEMLDANLKMTATRRTFLDVVGGIGHRESFYTMHGKE
jgi:hypothetical protein